MDWEWLRWAAIKLDTTCHPIHPGPGPLQALESLAPRSLQALPLCHKSWGEIGYHIQPVNKIGKNEHDTTYGPVQKEGHVDKLLQYLNASSEKTNCANIQRMLRRNPKNAMPQKRIDGSNPIIKFQGFQAASFFRTWSMFRQVQSLDINMY